MATTVVYEAMENADATEGRGPMVRIAVFKKEADAKRAAKGRGVMGYGDGEVQTLQIHDTFDDWGRSKVIDARESGLKKLTPEEREALGL